MEKILLTLFVGFCFGGVAVAQEPAKVAKKKAAAPLLANGSQAATPEMIKAKELDKAIRSGKIAKPAVANAAKAPQVADKQN